MIDYSIIIPTYNEASNIVILLEKLNSLCSGIGTNYEIIVVDDNSPDKTWEIVRDMEEKFSNLILVRRMEERGLSSAVLAGMRIARGNLFVVMDADLQHDESILPEMIAKSQDFSIVIGSRLVEGGGYGKWNWIRKISSFVSAWVSRKILKLKISEPLSGFFVIQRKVYETFADRINPRGFKILLEFIGRNTDFSVVEVGYTFKPRYSGKTKLSSSVVLDLFLSILEIKFGFLLSYQFLKYATVGLSGVFVNLLGQWAGNQVLGLTSSHYKSDYYLPGLAVSLGFLLSVVHNFFWNNYWTFREYKFRGLFAAQGFVKFLLVSILGYLIQISVWRYLLEVFLSYTPENRVLLLGYLCNLVGIGLSTAWNYYLNKYFTWKIS